MLLYFIPELLIPVTAPPGSRADWDSNRADSGRGGASRGGRGGRGHGGQGGGRY
jgi:hypothetical protein